MLIYEVTITQKAVACFNANSEMEAIKEAHNCLNGGDAAICFDDWISEAIELSEEEYNLKYE